MKKLSNKPIPKFKNEDEEREFWTQADTSEYFDYKKAKLAIFPNLKPSKQLISIRLTKTLLNKLKAVANKKDIPYQTLMKTYIDQGLDKDMPHLKKYL